MTDILLKRLPELLPASALNENDLLLVSQAGYDKSITYLAVKNAILDGALLKANDLSEIRARGATSQSTARVNIGCGTAATRNVAEEAGGDLIPVGYKGIFASDVYHAPIDFATYPFVVGESLFIDARSSTNNPPFLNQDFYYIDVVCATGPAQGGRVNRPLIQFVSYSNSTAIYAIREDDGTTLGWRYFREVQYDEDNATITAPGALRAFGGKTELLQSAVAIRGAGNKHLWFFDQNGVEVALIYAGDDKVLRLRAGEGPSLNIGSDGSITAPGYFEAGDDIRSGRNISSVGIIEAGAGVYDTPGVRVYSPNNPPPQQDLSPYATQAWVAANFLQAGQRLASLGTATNNNNDNEFAYAPDGATVTAVQQKTNYTAVKYRYLQYNINGNWYTAWVA